MIDEQEDLADCGRPASTCPSEESYRGPNRRAKQKWGVEKKIGMDALVAFLLLLLTGISYITIHAKWEGHVDDTISSLQESDKRHDRAIQTQGEAVDKRLERIEDKLDRVIEMRRK